MAKKWVNAKEFKKTQKKAEKESENSGGRLEGMFSYGMKGRSIEVGTYILRLLPAMKDDIPENFYRVVYFHLFQTPDGWVYMTCQQTFGKKCALCEVSKKLYMGDASDKKEAKKLYRQEKRLCNVYVVDDPRDGSREKDEKQVGTVRRMEYKHQIRGKIAKAMSNDEELGIGTGIIDPGEEGYNFILKVTEKVAENEKTGKVERYPSYEDSEFSRKASTLAETDEEIEKILEGVYSLDAAIESQATSPDEMYEVLDKLGMLELVKDDAGQGNSKPAAKEPKAEKTDTPDPVSTETKPDKNPEEPKAPSSDDSGLDADDMKFLKDLEMGDGGEDDDIPF